MRIAWMGPTPTLDGGAAYAATQLLLGFSEVGIDVDCFVDGTPAVIPEVLRDAPGVHFFTTRPSRWQWGRWYSRTPLAQFISGQSSRALTQLRLIKLMRAAHARRPYDFLYRFSQIEMFGVRRHLATLPPIVLHPSVHVAGELRWHRSEASLGRTCQPDSWFLLVRAMLIARARRQGKDIHSADVVLSLSRRFGELMCDDYKLAPAKIRLAPNPLDLARFTLPPNPKNVGPQKLLFVSRLAVRKGVEMVVDLSHRLHDLRESAQILVVGDRSQWSNYRCIMERANPDVLKWLGSVPGPGMLELYRSATGVLQPAHYEPFGLTVAEGLACGVPAVASDEVGAVEDVDRRCCSVFPSGDMDAFEHQVRALLAMDEAERDKVQRIARSEAERLFRPVTIATNVVSHLTAYQAEHAS